MWGEVSRPPGSWRQLTFFPLGSCQSFRSSAFQAFQKVPSQMLGDRIKGWHAWHRELLRQRHGGWGRVSKRWGLGEEISTERVCTGGVGCNAQTSYSLPTSSSDPAVPTVGLCNLVMPISLFPECCVTQTRDLSFSEPPGRSHEL